MCVRARVSKLCVFMNELKGRPVEGGKETERWLHKEKLGATVKRLFI